MGNADLELLRKILQSRSIQAGIHLVVSALVGESMQAPELYFRNNVLNTLRLLEAMRESNVRRIVFSASCATYGIPDRVPIPEEQPQSP